MSGLQFDLEALAKLERSAAVLRRRGSITPEALWDAMVVAFQNCGFGVAEKAETIILDGFETEIRRRRDELAKRLAEPSP
jgi:hypothetical protein